MLIIRGFRLERKPKRNLTKNTAGFAQLGALQEAGDEPGRDGGGRASGGGGAGYPCGGSGGDGDAESSDRVRKVLWSR